MSATFSEDAKALAVMLNADAEQAEGASEPQYVAANYPVMVEQIGKVLVHLGRMKLA